MADNHKSNISRDYLHAMQNEWARLMTFADFPDHQSISPIRLANSGFYYTGEGRVCRCFFCGFEESNWTGGHITRHCEEFIRRERDDFIDLNNRESNNVLFNGGDRRVSTASTQSFNQLWITMNSSNIEQPLHLRNQNQNQSEIYQWLRINSNIYSSNSLNLNHCLRPSSAECTNQLMSSASVFQHLRICEETQNQPLNFERFTSNQSVRDIIEGDIRQGTYPTLPISPPRSSQEEDRRVMQEEDRRVMQEEDRRVMQPLEKSSECVTPMNYLEEGSMSQASTDISENVISQTEVEPLSSNLETFNDPTSENEESIPLRMPNDDNTCTSDQMWISIAGYDTKNSNRGDSRANVKPDISMPGSMMQGGGDRGRFAGDHLPPMSRSVRNNTHIPQTYSERLTTFNNWPHLPQRPEDMADTGFYYTGQGDLVRCPYCGLGLRKWEPSDVPRAEHARFSPECKFVQDSIHQRHHRQSTESRLGTQRITLDQISHLDSLKEVLDLSFNIGDILQAYNSLSSVLDIRNITSTEILKFFFEADHEVGSFNENGCLCCMCSDRVVSVLFLPCCHGCCDNCNDEFEHCPFCAHYIKARHRVFVG